MRISDLISMSIRSLWRRKLRTTLTVLGVVIGTVSIVLMLSLGIAMDQNMEEQFAQWGDLTLINIYGYSWAGDEAPQLTDEIVNKIEKISNVERVIPQLKTEVYLTFGKQRSIYSVQAVVMDEADMQALDYNLTEGRYTKDGEKNAVIIGNQVLGYMHKIGKKFDWNNMNWGEELTTLPLEVGKDKITLEIADFDDKGKPLLDGKDGKIKAPKGIDVKVVGIVDGTNNELAQSIVISRSLYDQIKPARAAYQKKLGWNDEEESGNKKKKKSEQVYEQIAVKINHRDNVLAAIEEIKALGYSEVDSSMEYIDRVKEQSNSKRMALGGIGIVSFLVAAIGIANTMMMSIYERTKEIGVMKVIGAKIKDIKHMFLIEALLIGAMGGVVGSLISFIISKLMNMAGGPIAEILGMYDASVVSVVPVWLMLAATGFATLVGLVSGYFPAKKATKLSALSAIKTE
ncbi:ABC transporter permease [Cellulosilyticum ruminicola]|uniref:ABC transporter permease n=1 Tax=Cellulosilyticum ruminicola TaxID=425254 RepID=UPI0006D04E57|nr:ABC transporter permease [Cellulosilyticum ruminicola]